MFSIDMSLESLKNIKNLSPDQFSILIIDDNKDFADVFCMIFNHFGFGAYRAYDGVSGIIMASEVKPNLIFCDTQLPDMYGYEAALKIRDFLTSYAFFVAMTGNPDNIGNFDLVDSAFDFICSKPIRISELIRILKATQERVKLAS